MASLTSENRDWMMHHPGLMSTPVKARFITLVNTVEKVHADYTLLETELEYLRTAAVAKKRKRGGVSVANLGTCVVTTEEVIAAMRASEAATKARKKGKGKQKQVDSDSEAEDDENPFLVSI